MDREEVILRLRRLVEELDTLTIALWHGDAAEFVWPVAQASWRLFVKCVVTGGLVTMPPRPNQDFKPLTLSRPEESDRSLSLVEAYDRLRGPLILKSPRDLYRVGPKLGITRKVPGSTKVYFSEAAINRLLETLASS